MKNLKLWFTKAAILGIAVFLVSVIGIVRSEAATSIDDADADTSVDVEATSDEDKIRFTTFGTERMTIINTGEVGIGTSTPTFALEVVGTIKADDLQIGSDTIHIHRQTNTIDFHGADGNVETAAGYDLLIEGGTANDVLINTTSTGNVGIGTSTPGEKLEVNGSVKIGAYTLPSTDGTSGQVLETNGSGTVTWQTGGGSGDITDVFGCSTGDCNSITVSDGDLLNFSASNASSTTDGIILPQNTTCASATAEGQLCWDSDGDSLFVGDGTTANDISGLNVSGEVAEDTLFFDGTDWEPQGGLEKIKVGTLSRDLSTGGTQAITGVGFKPSAVIFMANVNATAATSMGVDDGTTKGSARNTHKDTTDAWGNTTAGSISLVTAVATIGEASIYTFDSDGFTLTWSKVGSPTGTVVVKYMAFR